MVKRFFCLILAGLMLLPLTGCGSVFEEEYYYEETFNSDVSKLPGDVRDVSNYSMLKTALTGMITRREEQCDFRMSNYHGNLSEDLAAACFEIKSENPLGAYAVETMSYETNFVVSYYIATVHVTYHSYAREIETIRYAGTLSDFDDCVQSVLAEHAPETAIRVFTSDADENHVRNIVRTFYFENAVTQVFEPAVTLESYPKEGANRILILRLDYGTMAPRMEQLQNETEAVLVAEKELLTFDETESSRLALNAAIYLSGLREENEAESEYLDSAYGALVRHRAGPKGLALAYHALCSELGIECVVVSGSAGALEGQPHYWNIIELDGEYYHVDVSSFAEDPAGAFLLNDRDLWGTYIWDTAQYPACAGTLRYTDLVPPEEPEPEENPGEEPGEETPPEEEGTEPQTEEIEKTP